MVRRLGRFFISGYVFFASLLPVFAQDNVENRDLFRRYWERGVELPPISWHIDGGTHLVRCFDVNNDGIPDVMEVFAPTKSFNGQERFSGVYWFLYRDFDLDGEMNPQKGEVFINESSPYARERFFERKLPNYV